MTEAPEQPEIEEVLPVTEKTETSTKPTWGQVLRGMILTWSVFLMMAYACLVSFSSKFMSNGKSQFQRVAQSISSGN